METEKKLIKFFKVNRVGYILSIELVEQDSIINDDLIEYFENDYDKLISNPKINGVTKKFKLVGDTIQVETIKVEKFFYCNEEGYIICVVENVEQDKQCYDYFDNDYDYLINDGNVNGVTKKFKLVDDVIEVEDLEIQDIITENQILKQDIDDLYSLVEILLEGGD